MFETVSRKEDRLETGTTIVAVDEDGKGATGWTHRRLEGRPVVETVVLRRTKPRGNPVNSDRRDTVPSTKERE